MDRPFGDKLYNLFSNHIIAQLTKFVNFFVNKERA